MLRNIFIMLFLSFIISYLGVNLLESLPQLVNKSYQPRLYDIVWLVGVCMFFSPGLPCMLFCLEVQLRLERR